MKMDFSGVPLTAPSRYDMAVIGTGPAGHHAAIQAAKLGKRVVAIERAQPVGGGCLRAGTIPSKTLREAVLYLTGFHQRGIYGLSYTLKQDITIQDLMFRCQQVVDNEVDVLMSQFNRNGVDMISGHASFLDPHRLEVAGPGGRRTIAADHVVIATGSLPAHASKVPVNGRTIIDADGILELPLIPKHLVVVGAGIIGMEYACIAAALGSRVTVVDQRPRVLEFVDSEISQALLYHMREAGVVFRLGEEVEEVHEEGGRVIAHTASNKIIWGDCLLFTAGRQGNTALLRLEQAGLSADGRGRITVNECFQTAQPHIYACGDVIGFPSLASVSMEQGRRAAGHAFGITESGLNPWLPYGIYTIPQISGVGRTEEELTREAVPYDFGIARYREIARGQMIGDRNGLLKLLVHDETRKVLGVHIVGEGATELIHIGQMAVGMGATLDFLVDTVFNYPTLAECYKVAALNAYNKLAATHKGRCMCPAPGFSSDEPPPARLPLLEPFARETPQHPKTRRS